MIVRHSEPKDIEAIRSLYGQPSVYASTLQLPYPSIEKWQERLGTFPENFYSLVADDSGAVLGQIGIEVFRSPRRRHVANIGLAVSDQSRRGGIGSRLVEAAIDLCTNWLAVSRIELETYVDNAPAIGLFQKHGFVVEGTAKNYAFRDGRMVDALLMARVGGGVKSESEVSTESGQDPALARRSTQLLGGVNDLA